MPALLTASGTSQLLDVLSGSGSETELVDTWAAFEAVFPGAESISACSAALLLLADEDLLTTDQRLRAVFVIWQAFQLLDPSGQRRQPFADLLCQAVNSNEGYSPERLLLRMLVHGGREVHSQPLALIMAKGPSLDAGPVQLPQQATISGRSAGSIFEDAALSPLIRELTRGQPASGPRTGPAQPDGQDLAIRVGSRLGARGFRPCWITPKPATLSPLKHEVSYVMPSLAEAVIWDHLMCTDVAKHTEMRELMAKAFRGALVQSQQQQVLDALENVPDFLDCCGLSPEKLPQLVESNPGIAVDVVLRILKSNQADIYMSALVSMQMSLHSMEVVNRLTTLVALPSEFIRLYISNCISSCQDIKDKYQQNRLVRLVCVFVQSLIRNKIINIQELFVEVQTFCIEFSRIKEAASLYRLLKAIETSRAAEAGTGSPGPSSSA